MSGREVQNLGDALFSLAGADGDGQQLVLAVARCLCTILRISQSKSSVSLALRLTTALDKVLVDCGNRDAVTEVQNSTPRGRSGSS